MMLWLILQWIFRWIRLWIFCGIILRFSPWIFAADVPVNSSVDFSVNFSVDFSVSFFSIVSRLKFFTFFFTAFFTPFFTADFRGGILERISSWVFWKFSRRPETLRRSEAIAPDRFGGEMGHTKAHGLMVSRSRSRSPKKSLNHSVKLRFLATFKNAQSYGEI